MSYINRQHLRFGVATALAIAAITLPPSPEKPQEPVGIVRPIDTRIKITNGGDFTIYGVRLRSDWDISFGSGNTLSDEALRRFNIGERPYRDSEAGWARVGSALRSTGIVRGIVNIGNWFIGNAEISERFYVVNSEEARNTPEVQVYSQIKQGDLYINAGYIKEIP